MISNILNFILKYLWISRTIKDANGKVSYKFNLWNPLGYVVLIILAFIAAFISFLIEFFGYIKATLKEAMS